MLKIFQNLAISIRAYGEALPQMFRKGYRRYLFLPIVVYLSLFVGFIWLIINNLSRWLNLVLGWFGYSVGELETWGFVVAILLQIIMFFFMSSLFKYTVLILLAPFLAFLSEKVEKDRMGTDFDFSLSQMLKDIVRAVRINLWNFIREMAITIGLAFLAFIPVVGLMSPIALFMVQSYFLGYGLMDYNAERWRWSSSTTESWMRRHKSAVAAVGLAFHGLFLIPFLGWIFAPSWSVIAGTRVAMDLRERDQAGKI